MPSGTQRAGEPGTMTEQGEKERKTGESIPWHRLFGLFWTDFFWNTNVTVELEKDLSLKKQLLDVVLILGDASGRAIPRRLPDGLEDLGKYNLFSFKSIKEPLG